MSPKIKILGLIPARGGSKGIPGKNVRLLGGKPLIAHTVDAALGSRHLDRIILSTDSPAVMSVCAGVDIPFRRPSSLASDDATTSSVISHLIDWLQEEQEPLPEIVVLLQPTAPLRTADDIDQCLDRLLESGSESIVSVSETPRHHHPAWQLCIGPSGTLATCDGTPLSQVVPRRQLLSPTYLRNGAIYAFRTSLFMRTGSFYSEHTLGYVMPPGRSVNIDTMDDWHVAERCFAGPTLLRTAGNNYAQAG